MTDLYDELGLGKDAKPEDIRRAYRERAKKAHPDTNKNDPDAAEKFNRLNNAYKVLGNETSRSHYDRTGETKASNADPLRYRAMALMGVLMEELMEDENLLSMDLIQMLTNRLKKVLANVDIGDENHRTLTKKIARITKAKSKLKSKNKDAALPAMMQATIDKMTRAAEQLGSDVKAAREEANEALRIIKADDYKYEVVMGIAAQRPTAPRSIFDQYIFRP